MPLNQNANIGNEQENQQAAAQQPVNQFIDVPVTATAGHDTAVKNQPYYNIEEKVAQLTLQLNQVFVKPYLQQALDYLKSSKLDAINSYNQLSDQVAGEIKIINQNTQIVNLRLKDAEGSINKVQEVIRNKYSNATEEEISTGQLDLEYEYNTVAEHYEATLQLSQEISNYKARVISLNNLQGLLDKSMIPFVSRLQLEIDNLELLIHNFDSSDYADIIAKKHGISSGEKLHSGAPFKGRAESINKLTAEFNNEADAMPKIEQIKRYEDVNQQRINTFANNNKDVNKNIHEQQTYETPANKTRFNDSYAQQSETSKNSQQYASASNVNTNNNNVSEDEYQLSRQEQKLMRKLHQQQIQMEHTIKMNKMIYEYNKSIDDMMRTQREYEQKYSAQYASDEQQPIQQQYHENNNSKPKSIETEANIGTLREHTDNGTNDRLFVARNVDQITDDNARQISKKFGTKSIRVVK